MRSLLQATSPTLNYEAGQIANLPLLAVDKEKLAEIPKKLIELSKNDWDSSEKSWDFKLLPIIKVQNHTDLYSIFKKFRQYSQETTDLIFELETKNELLFSEAYKYNTESKQSLKEVSVNCNPLYRYENTENIEAKYQNDTISEILSYSIGNMMGRYSLDREGLVYAHSGNNGFKELVAEGAYKTFPADDDGIVPLADEEWLFDDDATTRFREFVKTVWGEEHLQENLDFVAESLCLDAIKAKKGESSMDTIRRYFSTQFFKDHLKTYKKRPIYWLFSSGKEKAFECLVYLHRYNESTLSRMRTEYVTPLMGKLESRKNILEDSKATATGAELRAIDKELKTIDKKQAELVKFDEELKHLAEMKISIDLDDGVKVNYGKFGNLLADVKAIHGKAPEKIK
ncbi:class I SAM-dependent DNA methyltransferase [Vibrio vulnificus]|nr:class I SAM-dependent DNA methyltransferase [Vibrio vulnificus]